VFGAGNAVSGLAYNTAGILYSPMNLLPAGFTAIMNYGGVTGAVGLLNSTAGWVSINLSG